MFVERNGKKPERSRKLGARERAYSGEKCAACGKEIDRPGDAISLLDDSVAGGVRHLHLGCSTLPG